MQHNWKPLIALGCLLAAFSWPMMGLNPNYDFTIVAISGQTIDGLQLTPAFGGQPCINDSGEIVFTGSYMISPGNFGSALFTPNHVIVKAGDQIDGQVLINVGLCSLNNYGELLFIGGEQSGQSALFEKQGPSPAELVVASPQKIGGLELHQFLSFSVNDAGKIVFSAFYTGQNGVSGFAIFTPDAVLLQPGSVVDHHVLTSVDPMFALSSTGLFFHALTTGGFDGIFTPTSVIVKAGDSISGFRLVPQGTNSTFSYLAVSNSGHLVFGATFQNGGGIFTPESIVALTGSLPFPAAINDSDQVVYFVNNNSFVVNQLPLISAGDSINGHVINGFTLPAAINNLGAIVFRGDFTDGNAGIVLATPKS